MHCSRQQVGSRTVGQYHRHGGKQIWITRNKIPLAEPVFDAPVQTHAQRPSSSCDEYFPAPPFSLGLDETFRTSMVEEVQRPAGIFDDCCQPNGYELGSVDILGTSIDEGVLEVQLSQQINRASRSIVDMYPEAKEKTSMVIEIPDDDLLWDLEEIDLACEEAEKRAQGRRTQYSMENLSPTNFQTPEKTCCKDGEFGSSSSSGEITNKFERRIIKPPACKRSPFVDYNENRLSHCTPVVNRMYAAVLLHARLSEEETGLEDKRYSAITACLTLTIPFYFTRRQAKQIYVAGKHQPKF